MAYSKTIYLGSVSGEGYGYSARLPVEVEVTIRDKEHGPELAIQGSIWKPHRGDIVSGGQNYDDIAEAFEDDPKVQRIVEVWKRWHLNGMRAGCEHQRAEGWGELGQPCPVCGYKYGTAWVHEELPAEIIEEVKSW